MLSITNASPMKFQTSGTDTKKVLFEAIQRQQVELFVFLDEN